MKFKKLVFVIAIILAIAGPAEALRRRRVKCQSLDYKKDDFLTKFYKITTIPYCTDIKNNEIQTIQSNIRTSQDCVKKNVYKFFKNSCVLLFPKNSDEQINTCKLFKILKQQNWKDKIVEELATLAQNIRVNQNANSEYSNARLGMDPSQW